MDIATLFFLHQRIAQVGWLLMLLSSAWAIRTDFLKKGLDMRFFSMVALVEIMMIVQASIGIYMFFGLGIQPGRLQHLLYGGLIVFTLPTVYYHTRRDEPSRAARIWAFACFFMFGLILRATSTGVMGQ